MKLFEITSIALIVTTTCHHPRCDALPNNSCIELRLRKTPNLKKKKKKVPSLDL